LADPAGAPIGRADTQDGSAAWCFGPDASGRRSTGHAAMLESMRAKHRALGLAAWERGQAAFAAGDMAEATRWLDRALRVAPGNDTIALMLAMARLRLGDAAAAPALEALARRHDLRPVWLGLAAARRQRGDHAGAGQALAAALSRHAGPAEAALAGLADVIAAETGAAGWCALDGDGGLFIGPPSRAGALRLALDGRPCRAEPGVPLRLPPRWRRAASLAVSLDGRALIGSPVALQRIRRTEGFVAVEAGGLAGWAWCPGDPDRDPTLRVLPAHGPAFDLLADDADMDAPADQPLARPRRFRLAAARLAGCAGPLRVIGPDGRDLLGSPLDPGAEARGTAALAAAVARRFPATPPAATPIAAPGWAAMPADVAPSQAAHRRVRPPPASVVIPVHGGGRRTLDCLDAVLATVPRGTPVIVVDDASPEPPLAAALDRLAARRRIRLLRHARNRGFPASANAGLRAAAGDVVLLNSDTIPPAGWLAGLREAAHAAADIGTATPLSNDATILSYPSVEGGNRIPDAAATARIAALAQQANAGLLIDIPTAVGFCMYIRGDCLAEVGLFREDAFAQGYGEENDFSLRARHLGWRHVAAPGVYVAHVGGQSFGAARAHLIARNATVLNRLHPGYDALIAEHRARDPLAEARRRLDLARWRDARSRRRAVLLITHDVGGGVRRQVEVRCAAIVAEGRRPIVLRPVLLSPGLCAVDDGVERGYPNLRFAVPGELDALARFLRAERPERAELHHLLGHDHRLLDLLARLGVPYEVFVHDYAWLCPRVALVNAERRYCGEPDAETCEQCIADAGRAIEEDIAVAALRDRSAADLAGARRVIAPSHDAARRIVRHFPAVAPDVQPWDDDARLPVPSAPALHRLGAARRVCVVGAIGIEKGFDVLLAACRDAARRALALEFVVVGHSVDDSRLLGTGRCFVTGEYRPDELPDLIAAQQADLAWLPSIWPETWCFALTEAWRAGLFVAAFDLGAPAERIRATGRGMLLPLGLSPPAVNDALLAVRPERAYRVGVSERGLPEATPARQTRP